MYQPEFLVGLLRNSGFPKHVRTSAPTSSSTRSHRGGLKACCCWWRRSGVSRFCVRRADEDTTSGDEAGVSKYDHTIRGHICSSFLAVLLRHAPVNSPASRGENAEWADIVRGLAVPQEVKVEQDLRRHRLRSPL